MSQQSKYWTARTLKSRGWTEALQKELLPRPQYRRNPSGGSIRFWKKSDVLAAEQSPQFKNQVAGQKTSDSAYPPAPQAAENIENGSLQAAGDFLNTLWLAAPKPEGPAALLGEKYHRAIMQLLPGTEWAARLGPGKSMGRIDNFLALSAQKPCDFYARLIKNFVTAMPWLGNNLDSPYGEKLKRLYAPILLSVAERELTAFAEAQPEAKVDELLTMKDFPCQELFNRGLGYVYSVYYVPQAIRTSLDTLAALNPKDEYPEARAMRRHFVLHIGGTNTGKTYAGFQQLIRAATGVYLAPLRLLALEAQERLLADGVACSLTTGEEEDCRPGDTHVAATAEKLNLEAVYDVAVIDECQMIADRERGFAWTRAILGVRAPEIHLCAAPEAKNILLRIIQSCGDSYEVVEHQRRTPLLCMARTMDYTTVQPGDALITFSKVGVLSVAEDLRRRGKEPAIIYGALPYATRRKQVEGFLSGQMKYVVSTDAIGMGLNLPIRRIIFMETEKFDGHERRELKPEEIQQIAGRAGRYGMYEKGYVGAVENLALIRSALETVVPPIQEAVVGFSDLVTAVDFDLLEVLEVWNRMPTAKPYVKLDITRYITVISRIREAGFQLTKQQELRAANIPFDETDDTLNQLFFRFLRTWSREEPLQPPVLPEKQTPITPQAGSGRRRSWRAFPILSGGTASGSYRMRYIATFSARASATFPWERSCRTMKGSSPAWLPVRPSTQRAF